MHSTNKSIHSLSDVYDVLVIGGGIHGCAAAADAAQRGLSVLLVEQHDLASCTSSASSKLIHGGLRYLEHGELSMVFEGIQARANLLHHAPHLVQPLGFVLAQQPGIRASWKLKLGLKLYSWMDRSHALPASYAISRRTHPELFESMHDSVNDGFFYYDAYTQDARLTVETALLAQQAGAVIRTRTRLLSAEVQNQSWTVQLVSGTNESITLQARAIINTAGPWVNDIHRTLGLKDYPDLCWIQGSHIVVPRMTSGPQAYILQTPDHRVVFCIPYFNHTLIGTTDVCVTDAHYPSYMREEEANYLCDVASHYFKHNIQPSSILHHWSGIRTLIQQKANAPARFSRERSLWYQAQPAPIVSLYGGKLTTHRRAAQEMLHQLKPHFSNLAPSKLECTYLPGSQFAPYPSLEAGRADLRASLAWLPPFLLDRYLSTYGMQTAQLLSGCQHLSDLGQAYSSELYQKEIDYLCMHEWAQTAEDILWRRTSLGLTTTAAQALHLEQRLNHDEAVTG